MFAAGRAHLQAGRFTAARVAYGQARDVFVGLGLTEKVADCMLGLGVMYRTVGEYEAAGEVLEQARTAYTRLGLTSRATDCTLALENVHEQRASTRRFRLPWSRPARTQA